MYGCVIKFEVIRNIFMLISQNIIDGLRSVHPLLDSVLSDV